jgi:AcrR family transcriptional regulator
MVGSDRYRSAAGLCWWLAGYLATWHVLLALSGTWSCDCGYGAGGLEGSCLALIYEVQGKHHETEWKVWLALDLRFCPRLSDYASFCYNEHTMRNDIPESSKEGEADMLPESHSMREQILAAAVTLFADYGYHAATMRKIAELAGIQAASIYHHYPNKQTLLVEIMANSMKRLNSGLEEILQAVKDPIERLEHSVAYHIDLHTRNKREFFIIDTEMRALEGQNRGYILELRDRCEAIFQEILTDGMQRHVFRPTDVKVASYAIISMCTALATWFHPGGRLTVQQVTSIYLQTITHGLLETPLQEADG